MGLLPTKELSKGHVLMKPCPRSCLATTAPSGCGQGRACSPYIRRPGPATPAGGARTGAASLPAAPRQEGPGPAVTSLLHASCSGLGCCCSYPMGGLCSALVSGGQQATPWGRTKALRGSLLTSWTGRSHAGHQGTDGREAPPRPVASHTGQGQGLHQRAGSEPSSVHRLPLTPALGTMAREEGCWAGAGQGFRRDIQWDTGMLGRTVLGAQHPEPGPVTLPTGPWVLREAVGSRAGASWALGLNFPIYRSGGNISLLVWPP